MNLVQLLFGHVAFMVNFYADLYRDQDQAAMVSQPEFATNFNLPTPAPDEEFDFIVVGGGSSGCLVANRLARAHAFPPFRVLLLEVGGDPPPPTQVPANAVQWPKFDKIMFKHETVPQRFPNANKSRSCRLLRTHVTNSIDCNRMYSSDRGSVPGITEAVSGDLVYCWIYIGRPRSRGTVRLDPDHIENGPPLIDINMLAEAVDVDMYLEGIQTVLRVFENTSAYAEVGARYPNVSLAACRHLAFRSEEYWKCYVSHLIGSGMHPTGTCSMGHVVDSRLRMIGAKGLRVIDASIMPAITNTNIQAAVYVIAEKGAADILAEHGIKVKPELLEPSSSSCQLTSTSSLLSYVFQLHQN